MEQIKEEVPKINQKAQDIQNKLKENTTIIFKQLKVGCYRRICYNPYCKKNGEMKFSNDKDTIIEAMKIAKQTNCEKYICHDLRNKNQNNNNLINGHSSDISNDVENFLFLLDKIQNFPYNFETQNNLHVNLDFQKIKNYFDVNRGETMGTDIRSINNYFNNFSNEKNNLLLRDFLEDKEDKISRQYVLYTYYIYCKALVYVSTNPFFCYQENFANDFFTFFSNFNFIKHIINHNSSNSNNLNFPYLIPFEELKNYPEIFRIIIENYQNFLTLLLFQIGGGEEGEERDEKTIEVLTAFMKIFKIIFRINDKYKIVSYKLFYNESVNKHLNLKEECKIYFKILLSKNTDKERKLFCLIKYHWLFDAAAKSDILYIFNYHKQRTEMFSSASNDLFGGQFPNMANLHNMFLYIEVRRSNLIEDTLNFISNPSLNFKKPLKIKFNGEQGVDEGGVRKEFFLLLIRQLFDPDYGMFTFNETNRFFWFNAFTFEPKIKFELIGVILGLAFFNNIILDFKFPMVIYKKLLGLQTGIEDLIEIDSELYNNLKYLLNTKETNLKDTLCTTFTVVVDQFGAKEENGDNIFVDENNREEYVELYLNWYFNKSIENVFIPFKIGFYRMLTPEELELIICGTQSLDFFELEKSAKYDDGYEKESVTIQLFWEVIHSLAPEEQKKFLFFLTGCDRAPINGLGINILYLFY